MALRLIRKITTSKVYGEKIRMAKGESKRFIMQVMGVARGYRAGESDMGPYVEFKGDFAARLAAPETVVDGSLPPTLRVDADGDIEGVRAAKAFFPGVFADVLEQGLQAIEQDNARLKAEADLAKPRMVYIPNPLEVEFRVNLWAIADEKSAPGYVWEIEPLLEVKQADALTRLLTGAVRETPERMNVHADAETGETVSGEEAETRKSGRKHRR